MMKKAGRAPSGRVEWIDVDDPVVLPGMALVETSVVPLCTEYRLFGDDAPPPGPAAIPTIGHEAVGRVLTAPAGSALRTGTRVLVMPEWPCGECSYCTSGRFVHCVHPRRPWMEPGYSSGADALAERMIKPDWLLVPIPDDLEDDLAAMALCGLGPTFGACERLRVGPGTTVLIVGLGPVGLGGVVNALDRGAHVLAIDPNPYRRDLAQSLGATVGGLSGAEAVSWVQAATEGFGAHVAIDCTGLESARRTALQAVRPLGTLAFVGEGPELTIHVSNDLIRTGKQLVGAWHYPLNSTTRVFDLIRRNRSAVATMITHRTPLEDFRSAWDLQASGRTGKVLLIRCHDNAVENREERTT